MKSATRGGSAGPRAAAAPRPPGSLVTAVERVLDILETFQHVGKPLSLTELADVAGIPKSSCHAIVATLAARGYLYSLGRPRRLYPTRRALDVAGAIHDRDPFVERVMPLLTRLRDQSGETVILGKRQGDAVIYLQVIEGIHPIRYSAKPGEYKPLHSSATGKALLGSLRPAELRALLAERSLPGITPATLTEAGALVDDIQLSRRRGYFVTRGENVPDVWAVAAHVDTGTEILAIAVAGPRHRMETRIVECARRLTATCGAIARQGLRG